MRRFRTILAFAALALLIAAAAIAVFGLWDRVSDTPLLDRTDEPPPPPPPSGVVPGAPGPDNTITSMPSDPAPEPGSDPEPEPEAEP